VAGDPSSAELRPPSIEATLRFWYRAVDPEFSKRDVPRAPVRDSLFFGATETGAGQSKVLLTMMNEQLKYLNSSAIPWEQFVEEDRDRHAKRDCGTRDGRSRRRRKDRDLHE
jgi:CRISPR/Cas system CMR-associated protein Cmr1 (group 7 of RAMP superfamily)